MSLLFGHAYLVFWMALTKPCTVAMSMFRGRQCRCTVIIRRLSPLRRKTRWCVVTEGLGGVSVCRMESLREVSHETVHFFLPPLCERWRLQARPINFRRCAVSRKLRCLFVPRSLSCHSFCHISSFLCTISRAPAVPSTIFHKSRGGRYEAMKLFTPWQNRLPMMRRYRVVRTVATCSTPSGVFRAAVQD